MAIDFNAFQRNTSNDDLFATGKSFDEKKGYLGDTEHIKAGGVNTPAGPDYSPDGAGEQVVDGWRQPGTNAFDQDVDRYRRMGEEGQLRGPIRVDQTQGYESRNLQMGALGMLRRQGSGEAPSSAEIMSQRANQNAVQAAGHQQAAARGIGARIAATNAAGTQAGQAMVAANAANADQRAGEISRGQAGFSGGATGIRGQDIGVATADAELDAQSRARNEARQQGMERRGWDVRNQQQMAADRYVRNQQQQEMARRQLDAAQSGADWDRAIDGLATGASIGASVGMASDERTKTNVHSMHTGSLGSLYRARGR